MSLGEGRGLDVRMALHIARGRNGGYRLERSQSPGLRRRRGRLGSGGRTCGRVRWRIRWRAGRRRAIDRVGLFVRRSGGRRGVGRAPRRLAAHPAHGHDQFKHGFLVVGQVPPQFGGFAVPFGQGRLHRSQPFVEPRAGG